MTTPWPLRCRWFLWLVVAGAVVCVMAASAEARITLQSRLSTSGLGPLKIGMTASQAERAIGFPLDLNRNAGGPDSPCFTATVLPNRYNVFVLGTGFRVASISVLKRSVATRSGIRVGDSVARLRATYGEQLVAKPQFYTPAQLQYEIHDGNRKLIFSTDNAKLTSMIAGRKPEVDYVEGCA
jgi:hypothetical protein